MTGYVLLHCGTGPARFSSASAGCCQVQKALVVDFPLGFTAEQRRHERTLKVFLAISPLFSVRFCACIAYALRHPQSITASASKQPNQACSAMHNTDGCALLQSQRPHPLAVSINCLMCDGSSCSSRLQSLHRN